MTTLKLTNVAFHVRTTSRKTLVSETSASKIPFRDGLKLPICHHAAAL